MGRDTYIQLNNGGLRKDKEFHGQLSSRFNPDYVPKSLPKPHKHTQAIRYVSNGSGRDAYILYNSGGNHPPPQNNIFQNTLRDSPQRMIADPVFQRVRRSDFHLWQNWLPKYSRSQLRKSAEVQKGLTERLSTPRRQVSVERIQGMAKIIKENQGSQMRRSESVITRSRTQRLIIRCQTQTDKDINESKIAEKLPIKVETTALKKNAQENLKLLQQHVERLAEYQQRTRHSRVKVSATATTQLPSASTTQEETMQKLLSNLKLVSRQRRNIVRETVG
ncbi:hypothetical protein FGO68_gene6982 [Halteria grandinella]|uniref:Uncharacterized protein n=1 Tax=Halteria grandinella TaxID=5974 RepID=A0A8J8NXR5_HALGN|nr:hypothetical protein FGO68_gene6982 [Halteria grandinella]